MLAAKKKWTLEDWIVALVGLPMITAPGIVAIVLEVRKYPLDALWIGIGAALLIGFFRFMFWQLRKQQSWLDLRR